MREALLRAQKLGDIEQIETPMRMIYVGEIEHVGDESVRLKPPDREPGSSRNSHVVEISLDHIVSVTYRRADSS